MDYKEKFAIVFAATIGIGLSVALIVAVVRRPKDSLEKVSIALVDSIGKKN